MGYGMMLMLITYECDGQGAAGAVGDLDTGGAFVPVNGSDAPHNSW